jgi:hypothetical protein
MDTFDHPIAVFLGAAIAQWLVARIGDVFGQRHRQRARATGDLDMVLGATLTLLALVIGFSLSMAVTRYDQRKTLEAEEANAIGTEYARADLLPAAETAMVRDMLRRYIDLRMLFYQVRDERRLARIDTETLDLQNALWAAAVRATATDRSPVTALAVSGMNDVLNTQAYTQAAWWNRIPIGVWWLMGLVALVGNLLLGFKERPSGNTILLVIPAVLSLAFFLIDDIDSPRRGIILVQPLNLIALAQAVKTP